MLCVCKEFFLITRSPCIEDFLYHTVKCKVTVVRNVNFCRRNPERYTKICSNLLLLNYNNIYLILKSFHLAEALFSTRLPSTSLSNKFVHLWLFISAWCVCYFWHLPTNCFSLFFWSKQSTVRMLSLRGCILWTPPCSGWPSPARWGCPCPAPRAAPPMPPCAGTWLPETTFMTCPISATCMPTVPSSSTHSPHQPTTALSTTTSTSALRRTKQARFGAPAFTSKQVRAGHSMCKPSQWLKGFIYLTTMFSALP